MNKRIIRGFLALSFLKKGQQNLIFLAKLYCGTCRKYQQDQYRNEVDKKTINPMLTELVCESVSIRGISRILKISVNTVLRRIKKIAKGIDKPRIVMNRREFEIDELRTYIGRKGNEYWLAYALDKARGEVVDFVVGKRSKRTLRMLIDTLLFPGWIRSERTI